MADFLNHATIAMAKNGSTTHTANPNGTGGTVIAGAGFTPTAGRLLVVFANSSATSTTPSGWTLPTNGSAVLDSGLYVWTKTAAGSDTLTTTHNASDYVAVFDFYEFASGATFVASISATAVAPTSGGGPTLTGLTGTNWTAGVLGQTNISAGTYTITWGAGTEAVDTSVAKNVTDGYTYSLTYTDGNTATSQQYFATSTLTTQDVERLVVAVSTGGGGGGGTTFTKTGLGVIGP